ncbi:dynamin family protein [Burkholderia vietnamiensis]|uniref:dynamin family protein n=1 Tax=Burkholderia vietnamiensis TaxID=60552 RepID=UPI001B9842D1|nr:dynamin family protein [Burkholderia vietnamiensis]MBR8219845.1 dynamin family protein [Burkholderia vietnamiensis]
MLKIQTTWLNYLDEIQQQVSNVSLKVDEIELLKAHLRNTELLIPLIGAFSAGKSSLLNAFLEREVLPVGLAPETELATELRYGEVPHVIALRADGSSERLDVEAVKSIKARAHEFTHLQLYLDDERLKALAPLVLVDMPGFGSTLENHNKAVAWYLPRGVHFIVAVSVEDGTITQSLLRQIDDLQTLGRDFTVLLSKTNLRAADAVQAVTESISEQIRLFYGDARPVVQVDNKGGAVLAQVLARLAPEQIVRRLFEDQLKAVTQSLLDQIKVAERALFNDRHTNECALAELASGLRQIEQRRDRIVADLRNQRLDRVVERALVAIERELENAEDELLSAALSGNQDAFSRIFSDIVRHAVTRTLKEQMDEVGRTVVSDFSAALDDLGRAMVQFGSAPDWMESFTARINHSLQKTGEILSDLSETLAARNARELEVRKQETNWKPGQPLPTVGYRNIATILAVTTSVINPLLELAIIFLPEIISFIRTGSQREQLRQKIRNEVIPASKRELRGKLSALLVEQMDTLVARVGAEFAQEIESQTRAIEAHREGAVANADEIDKWIDQLALTREHIQRLAEDVLYNGNSQ